MAEPSSRPTSTRAAGSFNLIAANPDADEAVAGVAEVRRLLRGRGRAPASGRVSGTVSPMRRPSRAGERRRASRSPSSHEAVVGDLKVRRALPRRARRTVGAWCFLDHMGPADFAEDEGVDIGPHPHIGLQTVTWLVAGEVLHRDSLGSEQ